LKRDPEVPYRIDISDDDIYEAMKEARGYLDITPGDFKEVYLLAHRHAVERISRLVRAGDIMTREVFSVRTDTPLKEVAETMASRGVAGVPVLEPDGTVAGVISERDFLARMGGSSRSFMGVVAECLKGKGCVAVPVRAKRAEDIMSSPAVTVGRETTLGEIADIFTGRKINRVPVVDGEGRLLGIVSREDIVRASTIGKR
jgi:CBS-domain-containing membrane protein